MKVRPILFSAPMVRAILDGHKSVTRRALKPQSLVPTETTGKCTAMQDLMRRCPYGAFGDRLWVKETFWAYGQWQVVSDTEGIMRWSFSDRTQAAGFAYRYAADDACLPVRHRQAGLQTWWKRPALFMPRVASRLLLEMTVVGLGRACDLDDAAILAEGVDPGVSRSVGVQEAWKALWTNINGPESWQANPWVWDVNFRVADERLQDAPVTDQPAPHCLS
jgi:hypothetical protein